MPKVVIAFDRDLSRVGSEEDVSDDEARRLVREGRAQYAPAPRPQPVTASSAEAKTKSAEAKTEPDRKLERKSS
jgi:hypothetical protein